MDDYFRIMVQKALVCLPNSTPRILGPPLTHGDKLPMIPAVNPRSTSHSSLARPRSRWNRRHPLRSVDG
jgi:hypothetical protein